MQEPTFWPGGQLAELITAKQAGEKAHIELIIYDCRYDYEYEGGHIESALHLDFKTEAEYFEQRHFHPGARPQSRNVIIIFHCEFSQKRGPSAYVGVRCGASVRIGA